MASKRKRAQAPSVILDPRVRDRAVSATLAVNRRCRQLREQGRTVANLGLGQSPFPIPESVVAALQANAGERDYLETPGLPALREAVASHHRHFDRVHVDAEDIMVGPGSKELLFLLQFCLDADVIIPSPSWVSYLPQAMLAGRYVDMPATRPEDGWLITAESLDDCCRATPSDGRSCLLILNYPGNPTGTSYTPSQLRDIAAVARQRDLIVLSDEIYGRLHHEGMHVSIARFCPERTIVCSGLSKWAAAGGWRLGTFAFPKELSALREAMVAVGSETYSSATNPVQRAAVHAFRGATDIDVTLLHARRVLAAVGRRCAAILRDAGVRLPRDPEGGFYLFPDFSAHAERLAARGIMSGVQLCAALIDEAEVALIPGEAFGMSPRSLTARLAYVDFDGRAALLASMAIPDDAWRPREFAQMMAAPTVRGCERIAAWLRAL